MLALLMPKKLLVYTKNEYILSYIFGTYWITGCKVYVVFAVVSSGNIIIALSNVPC